MRNKKLLKISLFSVLPVSTCLATCLTSCSNPDTKKLVVKSIETSLSITNNKSSKTKRDFFSVYFDSQEITNTKNIQTKFIGDEALGNKVFFNNGDLSISWDENIDAGLYSLQWLLTYKDSQTTTPVINFIVNNPHSEEQPIRMIEGGTKGNPFFFSEQFFNYPSNIYNQFLDTASIAAIESADTYESEDLAHEGYRHIENLMVDRLHFQDFEQMDYDIPTSRETIGVSVARKIYPENFFKDGYDGKTTLIFLPIRSSSYGKEWADNLFVGNGHETRTVTAIDGNEYTFETLYNNHSGFNLSAQIAINFLRIYLSKYNVEGRIKLWLDGYSRGGGVANNIAGMLDRAIYEDNLTSFLGEGNYSLDWKDIYTYTFATPKGASIYQKYDPKLDIYSNIFNTIDPNDIVPTVSPKQWGFTRYGIDRYIGSKLFDPNFEIDVQKRQYFMYDKNLYDSAINFKQYYIDGEVNDKEYKNITPQNGWEYALSAAVEQIPNREVYVSEWQDDMMEIIEGIISGGDITDYLDILLSKITSTNNARLISWGINLVRGEIDTIFNVHTWDNYQSATKAADALYVGNNTDVIYFYTYFSYYKIYSRGFNYLTLNDTSLSHMVFKNLDKKTNEIILAMKKDIPYIDEVGTCIYNVVGFPYYIEASFPSGKYQLEYSAYIWGFWDGWVKVLKISSDTFFDNVIYEQHHEISPWTTDVYTLDLNLV